MLQGKTKLNPSTFPSAFLDIKRVHPLPDTELEGSADHEDDEDYFDDDYDDEGSGQYAYDDEEADLIPDEEDTSSSSKTPEFPPTKGEKMKLQQEQKMTFNL